MVTVTLTQAGPNVRLAVHKEGDPIPLREQADLFKQFRRADKSQTTGKKGWGLGLTLVKGMVQAHGGKVLIESTPGSGTSFIVELPRDSRPFQMNACGESVSA